jgi:hypothetical protein
MVSASFLQALNVHIKAIIAPINKNLKNLFFIIVLIIAFFVIELANI